ncbi:ty3-gypsy retrotransposon protein [Tanacetum coccineum]|uniref:Ty3-gypsy retrotransposon protein n=1 Tax=Tanacetum coccineum TaxID=301880 RepID=A0ABQ5ISQ2_9ASTR
MNDIFRPVLRKFVLVFFDGILVYSPSKEAHYEHLRHVFDTLNKNQFHAKLSKCSFAQPEIQFLGHMISKNGVQADPDKVVAIQNWPTPNLFTTLRGFLGLTGYYRRFVKNYAATASPLTDILKLQQFQWNDSADKAFQALKQEMESLVTLALPDFTQPFDVTTDASGQAIGAVLSQSDRPINFFSKKLCARMQEASTYIRELYAITEAIKKWRQYLLGRKFRVFTDQHSLKHLLTQRVQTPDQHKWITKLLGYDFEIHYKPGKDNRVADALSRVDTPISLAISTPTATWLHALRKYFATDSVGKTVWKKISDQPQQNVTYTLSDGLIYVGNRLFIPDEPSIRTCLLQEFHSSPLGGHSGVKATVKRLTTVFYWPNVGDDVSNFIKSCSICQQVKAPNHKPYGLLQPLPIPSRVWDDLSMDFITHLPASNGKTVIWVIVDRLSKFAHFLSLPTNFTAASLASIFLHEIYRLHGLPNSIVTDRDPLFLSRFWKELFAQLGTRLVYSSAYHPQTDGQTEVVNRCLQSYLRSFVCDNRNQWARYLYLAEIWYNTTHHSSIQMTPFEAVYGRTVKAIHDYNPGSSTTASIDATLAEHSRITSLLKNSLELAQKKMATQANKHRIDKHFDVGEYVYLRLRDYRQVSLARREGQKLTKRYYGPYKIIEKIGEVAYRLQLPETARIHPVFHVSLLRDCIGDHQPSVEVPLWHTDHLHISTPEVVLDRKTTQMNKVKVLIKWLGHDISEATWEDEEQIRFQFPEFPLNLEDEVISHEGGNDRSITGFVDRLFREDQAGHDSPRSP